MFSVERKRQSVEDFSKSRKFIAPRGSLRFLGIILAGVLLTAGCGYSGQQPPLSSSLLEVVSMPQIQKAESSWQKVYQVEGDSSMSSIAAKFYPDFIKNPEFYTKKIRVANRQNGQLNAVIHSGMELYIPDPRFPAIGFAAGEEAVLMGQKIKGKYWPTKVEAIDIKRQIIKVSYYDGAWEADLTKEVEKDFFTSRHIKVEALLNGIPGLVPDRVVFRLIDDIN